ncbi:5'-nucleotidase C-terminal domain-containing protein [Zunongwangia pacifica]|uniref:5'-nucleotidase C-terminal domain-containing protein n=1 Tax=Zunongwangia pacifica TaxID=2911062 RepID=A0A9X1ZN66_9FLAO|nr:5'-nucleotidase [Zunongwangia pacifica]MCL6217732.1 5'-nucleotidase C-terminal domain-containing protein [Zunongwangia pacifica]
MKKLIKQIPLIFCILSIISCKFDTEVSKKTIEGKEIPIDSTIPGDPKIEAFIAPFKEHLNKTLDSTLAYNPHVLSKGEKGMNTGIGNLMADIVMKQATPIFKSRTGNNIDFVLLNYGGIRSELNKGPVTTRDAYNMMPFENQIVIAELSGEKVEALLRYLEKAKSAHPVSGIKIKMNKEYKVTSAMINGKPINPEQNYFVATSDYLQQGGDNMSFFSNPVNLYDTDYKLRNAIIDYFQKIDTIKAKQDDRFIKE